MYQFCHHNGLGSICRYYSLVYWSGVYYYANTLLILFQWLPIFLFLYLLGSTWIPLFFFILSLSFFYYVLALFINIKLNIILSRIVHIPWITNQKNLLNALIGIILQVNINLKIILTLYIMFILFFLLKNIFLFF